MEKKYICLRDDDTSYFTSSYELQESYEGIWGIFPVTLAVIPFVHGSFQILLSNDIQKEKDRFKALRKWEQKATCEMLSEYYKVYPVGLNYELVKDLKTLIEAGKIEVAQHGIGHRCSETGPEMIQSKVGYEAIREGKEYLEKVFEVGIETFIPPWNTIDNICAGYVHNLAMDLFCCGSISFPSNGKKVIEYTKHCGHSIKAVANRMRNEAPPIKQRGGFTMTGSYTYDPFKEYDSFLAQVEAALNKYHYVSIATHYRFLLENKGQYREKYRNLVYYFAQMEDVEFLTAHDYIRRMKADIL